MNEQKKYIAKTMFGLEPLLKKELEQIGVENIKVFKRAVEFEANQVQLYEANYTLRTAINILQPLHEFTARDEEDFYHKVKQYDWTSLMGVFNTFSITKTVISEKFKHSHFMALKMKDAIVDQFHEKYGKRPNIEVKTPDIKLNLRINQSQCFISIDTSGDPLFKRGYRDYTNDAPLNEVLAASLVELMQWDPTKGGLMDFTCGTGTIPIEAGMRALNIPAGYYREKFGFQKMRDYKSNIWKMVKQELDEEINQEKPIIHGVDIEGKFIRLAKQNMDSASHLTRIIRFKVEDATTVKKPLGVNTILINPPYGERLLDKEETVALYRNIYENLKRNFKDCRIGVLSSNLEALQEIKFPIEKQHDLLNGDLECKFIVYNS